MTNAMGGMGDDTLRGVGDEARCAAGISKNGIYGFEDRGDGAERQMEWHVPPGDAGCLGTLAE